MHTLIHSQDENNCPTAQAISIMLWALAQLQHAPSHDVVTAMLDHLVALCQTPSLHPESQNINNSLLACAELGLSVRPTCVGALVKFLLKRPVSIVNYQHYSNVAWSLAVMGCHDLNTFEALLGRLVSKHSCLLESLVPRVALHS